MFRVPGRQVLAAKTGYAVACVAAALVLVTSGIASYLENAAGAIGGSDAISGGPSTGPMNILLMGLESRTDYNGNILPAGLLTAMHAGSVQGVKNGVGGNDANTLILVHIFAGGKKAVGFSIPRDDFVTLYGTGGLQHVGKIDQAYGVGMLAAENKLVAQDPNISNNQKMLKANEAGQRAEIKTVEALTGVHIDNFAVVNLAGFYSLVQAFGGVEVCLKDRAYDRTYSGVNLSRGYHFVGPAQALAFVRQRHNLPNGDLDRTHRQQAVLDYVIWKLEHDNVFSDVGKLSSLLAAAKRYVITDSSWNLLQFASEMKSLTGTHLSFQTLPVKNPDGQVTLGGQVQTVNIVDSGRIKDLIHQAFYGSPGSPKRSSGDSGGGSGEHGKPGQEPAKGSSLPAGSITVDVYNGGSTGGLAGEVSQGAKSLGFKAGATGNAQAQQANTEVLYGSGASAAAAKLARDFGVTAAASHNVAAGHVRIVLGSLTTSLPGALSGSAGSGTSHGNSTGSATAAPGSGDSGGGSSGRAVTVKPNAKFGIPCVN